MPKWQPVWSRSRFFTCDLKFQILGGGGGHGLLKLAVHINFGQMVYDTSSWFMVFSFSFTSSSGNSSGEIFIQITVECQFPFSLLTVYSIINISKINLSISGYLVTWFKSLFILASTFVERKGDPPSIKSFPAITNICWPYVLIIRSVWPKGSHVQCPMSTSYFPTTVNCLLTWNNYLKYALSWMILDSA